MMRAGFEYRSPETVFIPVASHPCFSTCVWAPRIGRWRKTPSPYLAYLDLYRLGFYR